MTITPAIDSVLDAALHSSWAQGHRHAVGSGLCIRESKRERLLNY
ncbi:MAG: hypothetical protein OEV12_09345 [Gammaproteobacteria bacterium]|nr:hypothetical protein [Gammaproteobacteria bacterium]MDH3986603.1 hypothetical protein [Gammaproteobacteria bacterium]